MTRRMGLEKQEALADIVRPWFPRARSTPNGVGGSDLQRAGRIFWENKTIRNSPGADGDRTTGKSRFSPLAWVESAARRARLGELPIGVFWPERVGVKSPDKVIALVRLPDLLRLLELAGYTDERPTADAETTAAAASEHAAKHPKGLAF